MPGKNSVQNDGSLSYQDLVRKAEDHVRKNDLDKAIQIFLDLLQHHPDDASIYNNLGVLLYKKEAIKKAINHFQKASEKDPVYIDPIYNMARVYFQQGDSERALQLIEKCLSLQPDHRNAVTLRSKIQSALASSSREKVAVLCLPQYASFLNDIVAFFQTKYDVKVCYSSDGQEIEPVVRWADIIWIEWANELAVSLTNHPTCLNGKKVLCRLHRYEAFSNFSESIDWSRIDVLIAACNDYVIEALVDRVPDIREKVKIIKVLNGINIDKFKYVPLERGKNIACLGFLNMRKNPMFLIQCFHKLLERDPGYQLFFGGDFQDDMLRQYIYYMIERLSLQDSVFFDGWQKDTTAWLSNKHYLVSTSIGEGHPFGIMEAMAMGTKPVIHNFPGAESFYPMEYIFNGANEFCEIVLHEEYDRMKYRKFIEDNYALHDQLAKFDQIVEELTARE